MPMRALRAEKRPWEGGGQNIDESQTLNLCFQSLSLHAFLNRAAGCMQNRELWCSIENGRITLPFNISRGHFVWNYILTVYFV